MIQTALLRAELNPQPHAEEAHQQRWKTRDFLARSAIFAVEDCCSGLSKLGMTYAFLRSTWYQSIIAGNIYSPSRL